MISVLIADDHPVVRAGLKAVLEGAEDIEVVASVASPDEAVDFVKSAAGGVDVVLMDLRFGSGVPGTVDRSQPQAGGGLAGGVEATAALRALSSPPQVLVVTNYSSDADILGAVSAGAVGYLLKDSSPEKLISAVRAANIGSSVLSDPVAGRLMGRMRQPTVELTPRELDVLNLVAGGFTNKQIAQELVLTEATVKSHLVHIFSKLNVESRTAAVFEARTRGIINDE